MRYEQVKNGSARSNTGEIQVVFDPEFNLRPVLFAIYSGYQPDRGTVQGVVPGDYVVKLTWDRQSEIEEIYQYPERQLPDDEQDRIKDLLVERHKWLEDFLTVRERSGISLPLDVVPENQYLSVVGKKNRLEKFMKDFGLPFQADKFMGDRKDDLRLTPRKVDLDLDAYAPCLHEWSGSVVSIDQHEQWFGSSGNGSPATEIKTQPQIESGSNYAHSERYDADGQPGIPGWRGYRFVIRICYGVHIRDHHSYGHSIDVWSVDAK